MVSLEGSHLRRLLDVHLVESVYDEVSEPEELLKQIAKHHYKKFLSVYHLDLREFMDLLERGILNEAITHAEGSVLKAASLLGLPEATMRYKASKRPKRKTKTS